jgi:2-polyprenyl-6-methoxyphenol hydroxylase-like FAD-dependent oxidoreductase
MSSNDSILVVGGGLGGLATALALGRKGMPVHVFEQAQEFGAIGYGIQLGPNIFHMFDRLGISDAVKREAHFPPAAVWFDAYSGQEVTRVDTGPGIEKRFKYPYINIHRVDLHHVLMDACRATAGIAFAPASAVTAFEDGGDHVTATTADGRRVQGRALIGADGLRSRVRAQLFGEREPQMIGWVAHRTTVPMDQVPDGIDRDIVALWGGDGFHIVHYPLRHGTLFNIVTVFRTLNFDQRLDAEAYRAELLQTYAGTHPLMRALIGITNLDWRGRIADRDPIRHWHKGRVTVLGDAAHAPLQSLAQGACMAIEDGVCLAELVAQCGDDFEAAFRRLEAERAIRTARVVFESRYMWTAFHPNARTRAKIHARFRAMSRDDVWDSLAWLYDGIQPPLASKTNQSVKR